MDIVVKLVRQALVADAEFGHLWETTFAEPFVHGRAPVEVLIRSEAAVQVEGVLNLHDLYTVSIRRRTSDAEKKIKAGAS
jgi:hypothetical protein